MGRQQRKLYLRLSSQARYRSCPSLIFCDKEQVCEQLDFINCYTSNDHLKLYKFTLTSSEVTRNWQRRECFSCPGWPLAGPGWRLCASIQTRSLLHATFATHVSTTRLT